jgi:uncharacterized repeat protein (TIGR01451 family)
MPPGQTPVPPDHPSEQRWPRPWRIFLIGLCVLILSSCRGPAGQWSESPTFHLPAPLSLPEEVYTGAPGGGGYVRTPYPPTARYPAVDAAPGPALGPPGMEQGVPLPYMPTGPWSPPGIAQPWPQDEYLRDGGDRGLPANVADQGEVRGLELEDTVAHYDTLDGRTEVEPSNRVHIYSPRFGAVRKVVSAVASEQLRRAAGVQLPTGLAGPSATQIVTSSKQNIQAAGQVGTRPAQIFRSRQGDGALSGAVKAKGFQNELLPYEAPSLIRDGVVDSSEMAFLARGTAAAIVWSRDQAVQVILDHQAAMADVGEQAPERVYTIQQPPGEPKLRVVKVASTQVAEPGDEVDFTIRFDNVGNQVIGNVTIVDNLTTRLEYVPDSSQCSLKAQFFTQPNEGGSLVIRCEITDPLQPGRGGVIRFRCRVR